MTMKATPSAPAKNGAALEAQLPGLLVVDDSEEYLDICAIRFSRSNYQVHLARNSDDALAVFQKETIHVVLQDLFLRGQMGLDLLRVMTSIKPDVPVIIMTNLLSGNYAVMAMREGAFDFVTKESGNGEMEQSVERALKAFRARDEKSRRLSEAQAKVRELTEENEQLRSLLKKQG